MNITVLVGNGFDIAHGINSSYNEFYNWYLNEKSTNNTIDSFKKDIKDDIKREVPPEQKTWADFETGLGEYTKRFTKDNVEQFLDCLDDARNGIKTYLKKSESTFNLENYTEASFQAFAKSICSFIEELPELEKTTVETAFSGYKSQNWDISFVSYNYTEVLDRILEKMPKDSICKWNYNGSSYGYHINRNVNHVHGTLNMFHILGVNDESQIENKELIETPQFKEIMIKSASVRALGQAWQEKAEKQIQNSRIICIYGMSLGSTDARWWMQLTQWLQKDNGRHLIIFWHESKLIGNDSLRQWLRSVDAVKNRLLSYDTLSENEKDSLKNRIHVVINTSKYMQLELTELRKKELEIEDIGRRLALI